MLSLLISVGVGLIVGLAVWMFFGVVGAIVPTLFAVVLCYWWIARRIGRNIEQDMKKVQQELSKGRIEQGLKVLKQIRSRYSKWQFLMGSMLDGQIGSLYYMRQEFEKARPYLERAFVRHWLAKAMLGVLFFRKKNVQQMDKTFESVVRFSSKQGLLWSAWAYCHWKLGNEKRAIDILLRGKKKLGEADKVLIANLTSLQNDKKMKMKGYGEQWYQLQLEMSPQMRMVRSGGVRFARQ